jgi:ferric-dicitrate binding protein FerR (iron transport regulator)
MRFSMLMECRELTNDVLADPPTPAVRAHLEGCAACRARRAEVRSLESELRALGRALRSESNPALTRRITARIPARAASSRAPWRWAVGLAAAAGILMAVVWSTREKPETVPPREMVAVPAPPPIENVLDPVPPPPVPKAPEPVPAPVEPPKPPAPAPAPAPTPAPRPVEPEKPAPSPVEPPPPAPKAPESKPTRIVLALAAVEGALDLQDGEKWTRVVKAAEWHVAAGLRSGERLARFTLPDGTRATLRPRTELRILASVPPSLLLERGEAFFDVVPGAERTFSVVTADARVQVTGTQFSVRRTDHTEIYVSSGEVRVSNEKGEVKVPAGNATSARKGAAPPKARAFDSERANAWRREMDPPETTVYRYDFEDGRLPLPWSTGKVVNYGPPRGLNKFCLQGSPGIDLDYMRLDKRVTTFRPGLKLRFRYWAEGAEAIWVQMSCNRTQDNFRMELKHVVNGKWETAELPVADFYRLISPGDRLQEGDRFSWLNFAVAPATGQFYFDDIELVEVQK